MSAEPLTHFLLAGLALFGLHQLVAQPSVEADTVVVTREVERWLVADFEQRHGRTPSPEERDALIGRHVDEEVLYREGIALGLDRSDPIVRRRVVQRMQLLLEDLAQPSDEQLREFFETHADAYERPPTYVIEHAYFVGDDARERAERAREALSTGATRDGLGQPFPHGDVLHGRSRDQLDRVFGGSVAHAVTEAREGEWFVAQSSLGWHVVRVNERVAGTRPALAKVRARVVDDWRRARRSAANERAVASLRARYHVDREGGR